MTQYALEAFGDDVCEETWNSYADTGTMSLQSVTCRMQGCVIGLAVTENPKSAIEAFFKKYGSACAKLDWIKVGSITEGIY